MQLNQNAGVFTVRNKEVGHIDRVVIDPKTKEITHIVMRRGLLWDTDKVIPLELVAYAEGNCIRLHVNESDLAELPDFEETHYVQANDGQDSGSMTSGPIGVASPPLYSYPLYDNLKYTKQVQQNIPKNTVAVKEGAKVITHDGKKVGRIEQVLTRAREDYMTHFVISLSAGLLSQERKMIPVNWIERLNQDDIQLVVAANLVARLPVIEYA